MRVHGAKYPPIEFTGMKSLMSTAAPLSASLSRGRLAPPNARLGLLIPSSNRLSEPQFIHFTPNDLAVHVMRIRMSHKWKKPPSEIMGDIEHAAEVLSDAQPNLIVFHCTGASMEEGPEGDRRVIEAIHRTTGVETISTAGAILEAFETVGIRRLVLISPYVQATNDHECAYLRALGYDVKHDVALDVGGSDYYIKVTPERWVEVALQNDRPDIDGVFLSCTNTMQIEAIEAIEAATGKPVVNSNQAVIWASLRRLRERLTPLPPLAGLGRLGRTLAS